MGQCTCWQLDQWCSLSGMHHAECETYYAKMYGVPETISTTACSSCVSKYTKCTIECDISVKIVALIASDVFQREKIR
jgi:hypothetical protein